MGIAYIFMWQLFKEDSLQYNFWYFFCGLWSSIFGLTLFSVPYVAMGYEMSDDFHERTNIMAIAQWIGQWAWVIAPLFWIIMYDPEWFPSADVAVRQLAIWVAIPCALCAMVPAIFIKSNSTLDEDYEPVNATNVGNSVKKILISFGDAFEIPEFRKLCGATFLIYNAFNTVASLTFFVIVYSLFNGDADASGLGFHVWLFRRFRNDLYCHPHLGLDVKKMGQEKSLYDFSVHFFSGLYHVVFLISSPGSRGCTLIAYLSSPLGLEVYSPL